MRTVYRVLAIIMAGIVPIVLILTSVRILFSKPTLDIEYRAPGFPADPYGFTLEERLYYGKLAIEYLHNDQDINFLGDQRFPAGQQAPLPSCLQMEDCTRLYNERELVHMEDVKVVLKQAINIWWVGLAILAVLGVWAWRAGWLGDYRFGLRLGGWVTVGIVVVVLIGVALLFGVFFELFHRTFFSAGSYMFLTSDTLIRLFPERLWRDAFIGVGVLSMVFGLLLGVFLRKRKAD